MFCAKTAYVGGSSFRDWLVPFLWWCFFSRCFFLRLHARPQDSRTIAHPDRVSYRDILEYFFQIHDPTTKNRQGNDMGLSYRSAIYYADEAQKRIAEDTIADVNASGLWPGKVVTEVEPVGAFWEAEPEHQDYLQRIPNGYTCHFPRKDWVLPKRDAAE